MKIAVNARFLQKGKLEGFGRFSHEILKRLVLAHPEHDFYFLFDRAYDDSFIYASNVTPIVIGPQARHPILFKIWFNWSVTRQLKKINADIFLSPDGYLSLRWGGKQVSVIHDLNFEHYPNDLPASASKYLRTYFPRFAKKASRIVAVSNYTKQDIHKQYKESLDKIDVVYNGVSDDFHPLEVSTKEEIKNKWTSGEDYFVYLGSLHPRKNIPRLIEAFNSFKSSAESLNKLVLVGDAYWMRDDIKNAINNSPYTKDIIHTGRCQQNEMLGLLGSAEALCYVSYFEGFGIPLIEAMKSGVPVISGNKTSLPEVCGEAAIMVDPMSVGDIANAMIRIHKNEELKIELIEKGFKQQAIFSWDKSAVEMWNTITKTLG